MRVLGMDPGRNREAVHILRWFGVRDLVLGIAVIGTDGEQRRLWWTVGMGCDLADAAACIIAARTGALTRSRLPRILAIGAPFIGAGLGAGALSRDDV